MARLCSLEELGERSTEVELMRLRAAIDHARGDEEEVRARLRRALLVAETQGSWGFGLRAACDLARLLLDVDEGREGAALVEHAMGHIGDEGPTTTDVLDAHHAVLTSARAST